MFSESMSYDKNFASVNGRQIAYMEEGNGDPILLLHGNPSSSFLWRNVMPELMQSGRVIVPDLIGQGDSEKLPASEGPNRCTLDAACSYVEGLLETIGVNRNVTLVLHDWESGIGFLWAMRHAESVKGIAHMKAIAKPATWQDWPDSGVDIFKGFRSEKGKDLMLNRNMFIEAMLPSSVMRKLSKTEMDCYRAPHLTRDDRQPLLNWPRQILIEGERKNIVTLAEDPVNSRLAIIARKFS